MSKLDKLITDALSAQEKEILDHTEELGYFALATGMFSGKLGWVSWVIMVTQAVLFLVGVWSAWNFFAATDALAALQWGLPATVLFVLAGLMKFSFMPQLQADRILRELKRIELLVLSSGVKD